MSSMDNELYDTFGDEYKTLANRVEQLEKVTDGDLIVMPDGTTYTMQDLGLLDVSIRVFYQADAPTGLNSSTHVGDVWIDSDDGSAWFWDGISWVSKGANDKYTGGTGLEALGPGVIARLLTSIDITSAASAPGSPTWGDIWRDTSSGNIVKRWSGSSWVTITDPNIVNAVSAALTDPLADVTDGGIRVFYTSVAPGGLNANTHRGDLWYDIDDNWKKYRWNGSVWIVPSGQEEEEGATDGLPPAYSPPPSVGSGIGSLFITWDAVPNADPIWYHIYVDDAPGVALVGANYVGQFWGEVAVVQRMPDDTPLNPNTTYYVKIVAMDADGAAPESAEGSGTIMLIDLEQFANDVRQDIESIDTIRTTADGKNTNYYQAAMPTGGSYVTDDQWFDTDAGYQPYRWNGTTWQSYTFDGFRVLANGTVTANLITAGAITTSKLDAGAVTADKLAANVITADAIVIGSAEGSNSVMNGSFESEGAIPGKPAGWQLWGGSDTGWLRSSPSDAQDGQWVLYMDPNTVVASKAIPIDTVGVKRYTWSLATRAAIQNLSATWEFGLWYTNAVDADGYPVGGTYQLLYSSNYFTTWQKPSNQITLNSGYKYVSLMLTTKNITGATLFDNVRFTTSSDSVLIADGAILATKIGANQVLADKIAANAITADKIAANAVTAGKVAANAITAGNIAVGQITAAHITSEAIQSYHIQSYSITADKISGGALDFQTITGAYIQTQYAGNQGIKLTSSYLIAYDYYGNYAFYLDGYSGSFQAYNGRFYGGLFQSSNGWQRIELGDTGWGDPVDELRMFNNGTVTSIRHLSGWTGYIYCNVYNGAISLHPTWDGWTAIQRGTSGPQLKFISYGLQCRDGGDSTYVPIQSSFFDQESNPQVKQNITAMTATELGGKPSELLKRAGLKRWNRTGEALGIPVMEARPPEIFAMDDPEVKDSTPLAVKRVRGQRIKDRILGELRQKENEFEYGLVSTELPECIQTEIGYSLSGAIAFLWEGLKEANERIEELEQRTPGPPNKPNEPGQPTP